MGIAGKSALAGLLMLGSSSCGAPPMAAPVGAGYELAAALGPAGGRIICYRKPTGACDIRIPPAVLDFGADNDFITAAVRPAARPDETDYYFIVRLFDDAEADGAQCLAASTAAPSGEKSKKTDCDSVFDRTKNAMRASNCAVRGPFTAAEFNSLRRCHCVPEFYGSRKLKCIPGVGERRI